MLKTGGGREVRMGSARKWREKVQGKVGEGCD